MKKEFAMLLFMSLASLGYGLDTIPQEYDRREERLEQERIQQELKEREEVWKGQRTLEEPSLDILEENSPRFFIREILLQDEEHLFDPLETEALFRNYQNQELGTKELSTLLHEITNHLIGKGYITTTVKVSEKADLSTGILALELVYGRVATVRLNDDDSLDRLKKFFLVKQKEGEVLHLRDLDTTTENFNYLEANQMKMEIIPSEKEGYSDIALSNPMKEKFKLSLSTNNHGEDRQNGVWRYGTQLEIDSPLGIGDKFSFSYTGVHRKQPDRTWKQTPNVLAPGQILPIGPPGYNPAQGDVLPYKRDLHLLNLHYTLKYQDYTLQLASHKSIKESSFYSFNTVYDVKTMSHSLSAKLNKILWRNQKSKISLGIGITRKENEHYLEEAVLSDRLLSIGELSLQGNTILWKGLLGVTLSYERGLCALGAERDDGKLATSPKAQFHKYGLEMNYYRPFLEKFAYRGSVRASYSNDVLYGSEKQSIGGLGSVGGYHRVGSIQGEQAIEILQEISYQLYKSEKWGTLSPYLAHGYGRVRNVEDFSIYRKGHISGLIAGLRYEWKYLYFDLAYARALNYSSYLHPRKRDIHFSAGLQLKF